MSTRQWLRQAHAPPHAQPPPAAGSAADRPTLPVANTENRRRTRSLPQEGHSVAVWTAEFMARRCSNGCSHARHTYS
jgi:hypothetical protein